MEARNAALLSWYGATRRDLPWRLTDDPWAILVSEVMAQQTQVDRVAARFGPFMDRFPTPAALAAATAADVLKAWSGLGYNHRCLRLRQAAQQIAEHGWPATAAALQALPGVGAYTAAAVACFAFGEQVPTIDTNLRRVLSRWRGSTMSEPQLAEYAEGQLPPGQAADWNQAIMDLGGTMCRPKDPNCTACPVEPWCKDPAAYRPPRVQGRFDGSTRQARGAVVKALLLGPAATAVLAERTGLAPERIDGAAAALAAEGMISGTRTSGWALIDG